MRGFPSNYNKRRVSCNLIAAYGLDSKAIVTIWAILLLLDSACIKSLKP